MKKGPYLNINAYMCMHTFNLTEKIQLTRYCDINSKILLHIMMRQSIVADSTLIVDRCSWDIIIFCTFSVVQTTCCPSWVTLSYDLRCRILCPNAMPWANSSMKRKSQSIWEFFFLLYGFWILHCMDFQSLLRFVVGCFQCRSIWHTDNYDTTVVFSSCTNTGVY